jgi:hypothetical protein
MINKRQRRNPRHPLVHEAIEMSLLLIIAALWMALDVRFADAEQLESTASGPGAQSAPIVNMDLSGQWRFAYTPQFGEAVPEEGRFKLLMPVPGAWDDTVNQIKAASLWPDAQFNPQFKPISLPYASKPPDGSLPYLVGTGWYRKSLYVPPEWRGRTFTLRIGQVVTDATVFVNGKGVYTHRGHNTEWEVPLGDSIRYGASNDLVIAVSNTRNGGGCRLRGWSGISGGIFAPVTLKVTAGPARVASLYVYPDAGGLRWNVSLGGEVASNSKLSWAVLDQGESLPNGTTPVSSNEVLWTTPDTGLRPWSDRDANLYELQVKLLDGGKVVDEVRQQFGLRRLVSEGRALKLNGAPVYLRGHCEHYYFPETCTPALDKETYVKRLTTLKQLGFNWLRFHTWVPTKPYLEAADKLGMMISVEGQDGMTVDMWRDIVRAGRIHPSVVIYCLGNEQVFDDERIEAAALLAKEQKQLAPDALFSPNSGERGITRSTKDSAANGGFGEDYCAEPFPHSPKRLAAANQFCDVFQPHIWGMLSYSSVNGEWREIERRLQIMSKPTLVHEAGIVGSFIDLSLRDRYVNTRIGPILFDAAREHLRERGVLDRAGLYYTNSVAAQELIRKDVLEMTRHCQSLVGYELLGAVDMHWHRTGYDVGILNEFFEVKPGITVADVLSYNGESVLLIEEQRKRVLSAGAQVEREIKVSWYGAKPVTLGRLTWTLKDGNNVSDSGQWQVNAIQPGTVASLGKLRFTAPSSARPKKLRLEASLMHDSGTIANDWEFWVFPPAPRVPENPQLVVTKKLDAKVLKKLVGGARVVLLGGEPLPRRALSFQQGIGGRPENNFATAIEKHPITDAFPHDGYFDWQFSRMANNANSVVFDDLPVTFEPVIEVVNSYKQSIRQAALFEWKVGEGRLIVCCLSLDEKYPEAAYFKALILRYASGPNLASAPVMRDTDLAKLVPGKPVEIRKLSVDDEGFDPRANEK